MPKLILNAEPLVVHPGEIIEIDFAVGAADAGGTRVELDGLHLELCFRQEDGEYDGRVHASCRGTAGDFELNHTMTFDLPSDFPNGTYTLVSLQGTASKREGGTLRVEIDANSQWQPLSFAVAGSAAPAPPAGSRRVAEQNEGPKFAMLYRLG